MGVESPERTAAGTGEPPERITSTVRRAVRRCVSAVRGVWVWFRETPAWELVRRLLLALVVLSVVAVYSKLSAAVMATVGAPDHVGAFLGNLHWYLLVAYVLDVVRSGDG